MAKIEEKKGSIFDSECQTIVNTVNCKGFMGKGIALDYRYRYPDMFDEYKKQCEDGEIRIGKLTIWKGSKPWIINFPTKNDWKYPSKIEYIESGLDFFVDHYKSWNIESIAFPRIGSTHGGLDWHNVKKVMYEKLNKLDLYVEIYEFDPKYSDKLFVMLTNKLKEMNVEECKIKIGIRIKDAQNLKEGIKRGEICSFSEIQRLGGFGETSMLKLYAFANREEAHFQTKLTG